MSEATSETAFSIAIVTDEDLQHFCSFIGENLPEERARPWPLQFSSAVQTYGNTSGIVARLIAVMMRDLYAPAVDTPPEWASIARQVADGIDAGWSVTQWRHYSRTEFPDGPWELPYRAVIYLLCSLSRAGFRKCDALRDFLLHAEQYDAGMEWTAATLLALLTPCTNTDNECAL